MKKIALFLLVALKTSSVAASNSQVEGISLPSFHHRASSVDILGAAAAPFLVLGGIYGLRQIDTNNNFSQPQKIAALGLASGATTLALGFGLKRAFKVFHCQKELTSTNVTDHLRKVFPSNLGYIPSDTKFEYNLEIYERLCRRDNMLNTDYPNLQNHILWPKTSNDIGARAEGLRAYSTPIHMDLVFKEYWKTLISSGIITLSAGVSLYFIKKAAFNFFKNR